MEIILAALQLLAGLFGTMRAYFELKGSGKEDDDHPNMHDTNNRPKHLKG